MQNDAWRRRGSTWRGPSGQEVQVAPDVTGYLVFYQHTVPPVRGVDLLAWFPSLAVAHSFVSVAVLGRFDLGIAA